MTIKNPRLFYLTIATIVVAIAYVFIVYPIGSVGVTNICEDRDAAMENYAKYKNDIISLKNFAIKRNDNCKKLMKAHKNETNLYKKMENCDLFENFASSAGFVINLAAQYQDYVVVKKELDDADNYIQPYAYCPQYEGVKDLFTQIRGRNERYIKNIK